MRKPIVIVAILGVLAAGGGIAYWFLSDDAPAEVDIDVASEVAEQAASTVATDDSAAGSGAGVGQQVLPEQLAECEEAAGDTGEVWIVDRGIGDSADDTATFVGYRLQEELVSIGQKTVVGRSPTVSGCLAVVDGTVVRTLVHADLRDLTTDDGTRDRQARRQALESDTFPDGIFDLTTPITLPTEVAETATEVTASGDLTVHGVTAPADFALSATRAGDIVTVVGSTHILFSTFDIDKPQSQVVLSVEDEADIELQLFFTPAA